MRLIDALLLPRGLGPNPWTSARYRAVARALDTWSFRFVVVFNLLGSYALLTRFPSSRTIRQALPGALYVAAGAAQQLASRRWPDLYFRTRHHILVLNRLIRVPALALIPHTLRHWITEAAAHPPTAPAHPLFSKPVGALGSLMGASGAMHTLSHVAAVPLPFLPQLLFQLLYLAILATSHLAPAAASLDVAPHQHQHQLQGWCTSLNSLLTLLASAHSGIYLHLDELNHVCSAHVSVLMVLFVQLYFCFVLPLYYAYRLELECRLHMRPAAAAPAAAPGQQQQQQQQQQPADDVALVVAGDVAVLLALVMVCWLAAIAALPHLPQWQGARPPAASTALPANGTDSVW